MCIFCCFSWVFVFFNFCLLINLPFRWNGESSELFWINFAPWDFVWYPWVKYFIFDTFKFFYKTCGNSSHTLLLFSSTNLLFIAVICVKNVFLCLTFQPFPQSSHSPQELPPVYFLQFTATLILILYFRFYVSHT